MTKRHSLRLVVLGTLFTATMGYAHAAPLVPHEYTGEPYTFFLDTGDPANPNPYLSASQQFVSGRMTIDTALLPGGTGENVPFGDHTSAVVDFSFFDGVLRWPDTPGLYVFEQFAFATDSQGQLSSWDIQLLQDKPDLFIGPDGDRVVDAHLGPRVGFDTVRSDMPGQFEVVPVPAALPLMASALVGLGFVARRRRRREAAA